MNVLMYGVATNTIVIHSASHLLTSFAVSLMVTNQELSNYMYIDAILTFNTTGCYLAMESAEILLIQGI